jgi:hypothetical protein
VCQSSVTTALVGEVVAIDLDTVTVRVEKAAGPAAPAVGADATLLGDPWEWDAYVGDRVLVLAGGDAGSLYVRDVYPGEAGDCDGAATVDEVLAAAVLEHSACLHREWSWFDEECGGSGPCGCASAPGSFGASVITGLALLVWRARRRR